MSHAYALRVRPLFVLVVALAVILVAVRTVAHGRYGSAHAPAAGWRTLAAPPIPVAYCGVGRGKDGHVYVFGGNVLPGDRRTNATQIFDLVRNRWTSGAPLPVPVTEPGVATDADGRIHVLGGNMPGPGRHAANTHFEYDPGTNVWRTRAPLPSARAALTAVVARDGRGRRLIYAIGGRDFNDQRNGLPTVEAYDPKTGGWSGMASMPTGRHALAAASGPDGKIYVVGGAYRDASTGPQFVDAIEVYNPRDNTWSSAASFPHALECAGVTATSDGIYVLGGWYTPDKVEERAFWRYDVGARKWTQLTAAPVPFAAGGAATVATARRSAAMLFLAGTPDGKTCEEYVLAKKSDIR